MNSEIQIQAEIDALREQFPETKALYREVCALLFFRHGITPTASKLYQFVKKGSMGVPAEALAQFWEDLRQKSKVEIEQPDLPDALKNATVEAITAIWRQALESAREEMSALRAEVEAERVQAQQAQAAAEQDAAAARAETERFQEEYQLTHSSLQERMEELSVERREHAATQARLEQLTEQSAQEIARQKQAQQEMQANFSEELNKARAAVDTANERSDAAERRALMEIDKERQRSLAAEKRVEGIREQLAQTEAREKLALTHHTDTMARTEARLQSSQTMLQDAQKALQSVQADLRTAQIESQNAQQEAIRYRVEAQTLQTMVERLTVQLTPKVEAPKNDAEKDETASTPPEDAKKMINAR